jgi:hypothetical protein
MVVTRVVAVVTAVGCALGCNTPSSPAERGSPQPSSSLPAPLPEVASHASASPARPIDAGSPHDAGACPAFASSLERGRRASRKGEWSEAIGAFDDAIHAKPFDALAWAERGYAGARSDSAMGESDPLDELEIARSLTKSRAVLAAVWFNEAELLAKRGDKPGARLRYAISARYGNPAADARLAGESTCALSITADSTPPIPFVHGWLGVLGAVGDPLCSDRFAHATTEAAARKEACKKCEGPMDKLVPAGCDGDGPWTLPHGVVHFHRAFTTIQSMGAGRFVVWSWMDDDKPPLFERDGDRFKSTTVAPGTLNDFAIQRTEVSAEVMAYRVDQGCPVDVSAETELEMPVHPQMGEARAKVVGPRVTTYWDAQGKGLLAVSSWTDDPVNEAFEPGEAHITGAGCDVTESLVR